MSILSTPSIQSIALEAIEPAPAWLDLPMEWPQTVWIWVTNKNCVGVTRPQDNPPRAAYCFDTEQDAINRLSHLHWRTRKARSPKPEEITLPLLIEKVRDYGGSGLWFPVISKFVPVEVA